VLHMQSAAVRIGIDRHRRDAELAARTKQTKCNLAAVGDQDLAQGSHQ
jgi:hypothetical protein